MTVNPVGLFATGASAVITGGTPVTLMYGPVRGGFIVNPAAREDQDLDLVEVLYVDPVNPASLGTTSTTIVLQPGQVYRVPANQTTNVSVNAASSGHKFTAVTFQPQSTIVPADLLGVINPCLQNVIPSYLYVQYRDDDDLQAWVSAYNAIAQAYVTWLNATPLPVYTSSAISDDLLDWVANGLYGVSRPVLSAGNLVVSGLLNTYDPNAIVMNGGRLISTPVFTVVDDDIFKRVLTWKLYKGDGKVIDIRWLKRRILRFLLGVDGVDVNAGDTTGISITFTSDTVVTITVITDEFRNTGTGDLFNDHTFNDNPFNQGGNTRLFQTVNTYTHGNRIDITVSSSFVDAPIFKQAIEQGVLSIPFQYTVAVHIV